MNFKVVQTKESTSCEVDNKGIIIDLTNYEVTKLSIENNSLIIKVSGKKKGGNNNEAK